MTNIKASVPRDLKSKKKCTKSFKGTVSVISKDPTCKDDDNAHTPFKSKMQLNFDIFTISTLINVVERTK